MSNSYVDFMCNSLISTLYDNKSLVNGKDIKVILVKKDKTRRTLNCTKDNIDSTISRVLQFTNTRVLLSSIEIECDGKYVTSIEIV